MNEDLEIASGNRFLYQIYQNQPSETQQCEENVVRPVFLPTSRLLKQRINEIFENEPHLGL